jgi:hypothetical protein
MDYDFDGDQVSVDFDTGVFMKDFFDEVKNAHLPLSHILLSVGM